METRNDTQSLGIEVSDVTGQKLKRISFDPEATVAELLEEALPLLGMPRTDTDDVSGGPILYSPRTSDGTPLSPSDRLADAIQPGARIVFHPTVVAGGVR